MGDILDFGSPAIKRTVTIIVLIYLGANALGFLPESLVTDIFGISTLIIAGVMSILSAYWVGKKLMTFA